MVEIARPDEENIARWKTASKTPDPRDGGVGPIFWSVNLSRRAAYQPPDFRRAAAVPL